MRFVVLSAVLLLAACGSDRGSSDEGPANLGFSLFGGPSVVQPAADNGQPVVASNGQLGVNGYLWTASLDTLKFMPLASEDASGGVIITDWYSVPEVPNERVKVNVYILDKRLRADGIRVSVFRQTRPNANGNWAAAGVNPDTATKLEDAILSRARQLRLADVGDTE